MARKPPKTRRDVIESWRMLFPLIFLLLGTWFILANPSQEGFMFGAISFGTGLILLAFFLFAPLQWIEAFDNIEGD